MPLYNNILSRTDTSKKPADGEKPSPKNASMKLLQDHLLAKRRQQSNLKTPKTQPVKPTTISSKYSVDSEDDDDDRDEEYDPACPNCYEVLQKEYLRVAELKRKQVKETKDGKPPKGSMMAALGMMEDDSDSDKEPKYTRPVLGVSIAPPPILTTLTPSPDNDAQPDETMDHLKSVTTNRYVSSIAAKIMSKMGYKEGQGLGKDAQGMSKPLEISMTGISGRIVVPEEAKNTTITDVQPQESRNHPRKQDQSSKVILLQNMVGPGEVDDELESETKEECKKYGEVSRCLIYEIPSKKVPDDQAVRIFVEFCQEESAIRALNDLNGRYFGGRTVKALFYSQEKFNRYELAPEVAYI